MGLALVHSPGGIGGREVMGPFVSAPFLLWSAQAFTTGTFFPPVASATPTTHNLIVAVTPHPMALTRQLFGNVKEIGGWQVRMCSETSAVLNVPTARVFIAAVGEAGLSFITPNDTAVFMTTKRNERRAVKVARRLGYLAQVGTAVAGYSGAPVDLVVGLAMGVPLAQVVSKGLEERTPVFDPRVLLQGTVRLEPYGCAEGTVFAGLVRGARPHVFRVTVPGVNVPGISSIPPIPSVPSIP